MLPPKTRLRGARAPNPRTPRENMFFDGLERGFNADITRQVPASARHFDAIWRVHDEPVPLFSTLGIESRRREICVEHMSSALKRRTLERFRNLVQEEHASKPNTLGVIFSYADSPALVRKEYLIPCQTPGHYRFGPRLMDQSPLDLYVVVPSLLPEGPDFTALRLYIAKTAEDYARVSEELEHLKKRLTRIPSPEPAMSSLPPLRPSRRPLSDHDLLALERVLLTAYDLGQMYPSFAERSTVYQEIVNSRRVLAMEEERRKQREEVELKLQETKKKALEADLKAKEAQRQTARETILSLAQSLAPELLGELQAMDDIEAIKERLTTYLKSRR